MTAAGAVPLPLIDILQAVGVLGDQRLLAIEEDAATIFGHPARLVGVHAPGTFTVGQWQVGRVAFVSPGDRGWRSTGVTRDAIEMFGFGLVDIHLHQAFVGVAGEALAGHEQDGAAVGRHLGAALPKAEPPVTGTGALHLDQSGVVIPRRERRDEGGDAVVPEIEVVARVDVVHVFTVFARAEHPQHFHARGEVSARWRPFDFVPLEEVAPSEEGLGAFAVGGPEAPAF